MPRRIPVWRHGQAMDAAAALGKFWENRIDYRQAFCTEFLDHRLVVPG